MIAINKQASTKTKKRVPAHSILHEKETKKKVKLEEFNEASNEINIRDVEDDDDDDNCGDDYSNSILSDSMNSNSQSELYLNFVFIRGFVRGIRFTQ